MNREQREELVELLSKKLGCLRSEARAALAALEERGFIIAKN